MARAATSVLLLVALGCGPSVGGTGGGDGGGDAGTPDAGGPDVGGPDRWAKWFGIWHRYSVAFTPGAPEDSVDALDFRELDFRGDGTVLIAFETCPGTFRPAPPAGQLTYRHEDLYTWKDGPDGYPRLTFVSHTDDETFGHEYDDAEFVELRPGPSCDVIEVWSQRPGEDAPAMRATYAPGDLCMLYCDYAFGPGNASYSMFDYCTGQPPPPCE